MKTKSIFKSKIFWLNVIAALIMMAEQLSLVDVISTKLLLATTIVLNVVLRVFFTDSKIKLAKEIK